VTVGKGGGKDPSQTYEWDFCGPLELEGKCYNASVCQTSTKKSCGQWPPIESWNPYDEALELEFRGGTVGCGGHERVSKVTLFCAEEPEETIAEKELCHYEINLKGKKYCPERHHEEPPSNCAAEELSGHWTDLSHFGTIKGDIAPYEYYVNLCGNVTGVEGCTNSMICQKEGKMTKALAKKRQNDIPRTGSSPLGVTMSYGDGQMGCGGIVRDVTVFFNCAPQHITPEIIQVTEPQRCHYNFVIAAKDACPPTIGLLNDKWAGEALPPRVIPQAAQAQQFQFDPPPQPPPPRRVKGVRWRRHWG
jgi:hypothetical protein